MSSHASPSSSPCRSPASIARTNRPPVDRMDVTASRRSTSASERARGSSIGTRGVSTYSRAATFLETSPVAPPARARAGAWRGRSGRSSGERVDSTWTSTASTWAGVSSASRMWPGVTGSAPLGVPALDPGVTRRQLGFLGNGRAVAQLLSVYGESRGRDEREAAVVALLGVADAVNTEPLVGGRAAPPVPVRRRRRGGRTRRRAAHSWLVSASLSAGWRAAVEHSGPRAPRLAARLACRVERIDHRVGECVH
jgi:hypothetical protein